MKTTFFYTGFMLYLSAKGAIFLYETTNSLIVHYLVFIVMMLCAKFLIIDTLIPAIKKGKRK